MKDKVDEAIDAMRFAIHYIDSCEVPEDSDGRFQVMWRDEAKNRLYASIRDLHFAMVEQNKEGE